MPSYQQRESGLWSVRFDIIENGMYKTKRLSGFKLKNDAKQAYIQFMADYKPTGLGIQSKSYIFDDLLEEYFKYYSPETRESTIYEKRHTFAKYITPLFTQQNIKKIPQTKLADWQSSLWNMKVSYRQKSKVRNFFNHFLNYCEQFGIQNKLKNIKLPRNTDVKKDITFWELDDFNNFIKYVDNSFWRTFYYFLFYTGVRIGEACAFYPKDYNIKNGNISINKSLSYKTIDGSIFKIVPTKNYKNYSKPIPDVLIGELKNISMSGVYLFGRNNETPLARQTLAYTLDYYIKRAQDSGEKIKRITPHGFRHSYVSMLINLGVDVYTIAKLIGDTVEMVIKIYGHMYTNELKNAINKINNIGQESGQIISNIS